MFPQVLCAATTTTTTRPVQCRPSLRRLNKHLPWIRPVEKAHHLYEAFPFAFKPELPAYLSLPTCPVFAVPTVISRRPRPPGTAHRPAASLLNTIHNTGYLLCLYPYLPSCLDIQDITTLVVATALRTA